MFISAFGYYIMFFEIHFDFWFKSWDLTLLRIGSQKRFHHYSLLRMEYDCLEGKTKFEIFGIKII